MRSSTTERGRLDRPLDHDGHPFDVGSRVVWWPAGLFCGVGTIVDLDGDRPLLSAQGGRNPGIVTPDEIRLIRG